MVANQAKTAFLLASLSGILLLLGRWIGGEGGIVIALIIAVMMNIFAYFYSDRLVLKMYGALPLDEQEHHDIYHMVRELCDEADIPMPKLWYIPSSMSNAFATGRDPEHASVAVTQGILELLQDHELRGVLAHEIAHIKNRDILIATVAATLATAISYLANMLQWAVIFGIGSRDGERDRSSGFGALIAAMIMPIAATLIQLAISRSREYLADETGAHFCHDPLALASALEKLHWDSQRASVKAPTPAHATAASLFIVYPFNGKGLDNLFSTHPPMGQRIMRLRQMVR